MSTCLNVQMLQNLMLKDAADNGKQYGHSIFHSEDTDKKTLDSDYLIELLLLFDTSVYDIETLSQLFDVSQQDILLFTDNCPAYGDAWSESIGTMWTKGFRFYEDDISDLSWLAKYAIKRADLAIKMQTTLMNATKEMAEELDDDDGWNKENEFLRFEGQVDRRKRLAILNSWCYRSEMEVEEDGDYTST